MDAWIPALIGVVLGASIPSLLQRQGAHQTRLEDAYADLAGAAGAFRWLTIESAFGDGEDAAEVHSARLRFDHCCARIQMLDDDVARLDEIEKLRQDFVRLTGRWVRLDGKPESDRDLVERSQEHLQGLKSVDDRITDLMKMVRRSRG